MQTTHFPITTTLLAAPALFDGTTGGTLLKNAGSLLFRILDKSYRGTQGADSHSV